MRIIFHCKLPFFGLFARKTSKKPWIYLCSSFTSIMCILCFIFCHIWLFETFDSSIHTFPHKSSPTSSEKSFGLSEQSEKLPTRPPPPPRKGNTQVKGAQPPSLQMSSGGSLKESLPPPLSSGGVLSSFASRPGSFQQKDTLNQDKR